MNTIEHELQDSLSSMLSVSFFETVCGNNLGLTFSVLIGLVNEISGFLSTSPQFNVQTC